jgi:hypothetical protein
LDVCDDDLDWRVRGIETTKQTKKTNRNGWESTIEDKKGVGTESWKRMTAIPLFRLRLNQN